MTVIGFIVTGAVESEVLHRGNPVRLTHEVDYAGRICGYDSEVKDRPNGYYMATGAVVCVKHCPKKTDYSEFVCFDSVLDDGALTQTEYWEFVAKGKCLYHSSTKAFLYRCAFFSDKSTNVTELEAVSSQYIDTDTYNIPSKYSDGGTKSWSDSFFNDMYAKRGYIFGFGLGISLFLSFFYLYFLRIPGVLSLIIWTIIITIQLILLVGSILLYSLSLKWASSDSRTAGEVLTMKALAVIGFILTVLYLCLMCVMRKRIMLAISIIKEAARALAAMPVIILMPVFQAFAVVIFLVPWVIYSVYLGSSGEVKVNEVTINGATAQYRTMEYDNNTRYAFLYMLFIWYWTSEFILAVGQLVSSMSIAAWFFNRDRKSEGNATVLWAFRTTCFNHLGTAAFGSLIIAIIKTIQAILSYLQRKAKKSGNKLAQYVLCILQCCMWCLEKCMRFLSKNAYIQTSIYGYSFCKACRAAFFLIARNVLRVFAVSMVGDFVLLMGRVCVPLLTTFLCYLALAYSGEEVAGIIGPILICFVLAYFVATLFIEVFGMAISTILVCYCADEEMFPPEQRFADGNLRSAIQNTHSAATSAGQVAPEEAAKGNGDVLL